MLSLLPHLFIYISRDSGELSFYAIDYVFILMFKLSRTGPEKLLQASPYTQGQY